MRLTRREFARLLALSLAGTAAAGAAGLAAPAGTPAPGRLDPALPLHPLLQYGALVEPDKVVRVLMQTARPDRIRSPKRVLAHLWEGDR